MTDLTQYIKIFKELYDLQKKDFGEDKHAPSEFCGQNIAWNCSDESALGKKRYIILDYGGRYAQLRLKIGLTAMVNWNFKFGLWISR